MHFLDYSLFIFIIVNIFLVTNFKKIKFLHHILDKPDKKRKFHLKATPLAGGIILMINLLIYFLIMSLSKEFLLNEVFFSNSSELYIFIISSFIIFFIGIFDDKYNLTPNYKFLLLFIIITATLIFDQNLLISTISFSFYDEAINIKKFSLFFSLFCFLVFLNAFNMFDGINLQASIYSIIIFSFILFYFTNSYLLKILLIYLIFYSYLNFKNKSFLGDGGSLLIAFLISYMFIKLYNIGQIKYTDEIFIFMMLPGLDLIRVFFKRILNQKNPLKPDRSHLHHLLSSKFKHFKSLIIIQLIIIIPIVLSQLEINRLLIILPTIFCYSFIVYKLSR
jgi:UDP-GlcNAc:undecaprenyl-phosphate/decaprenyl-phosphate GlcNAc-1-phosphate transferase